VEVDPDDPAAQAIRQTARGLVALLPVELPVLSVTQVAPGEAPAPTGMTLPMAG
jgi:ATP-binding protein involved in chromosome partitioning